jgi:hypothetical protein
VVAIIGSARGKVADEVFLALERIRRGVERRRRGSDPLSSALDRIVAGRRLQPERDFRELLRVAAVGVPLHHERESAKPEHDDESGEETAFGHHLSLSRK